MKILYHHRIRSKDGQYVHVEELIEALRRAGHTVVVSAPAVTGRAEFGADAGFVAWLKSHFPRHLYELMEVAYAGMDFLRLCRDLRRHRPDFIYERYNLYLPSGVWAKKIFGVPLLLEVNAPVYRERKQYDGIAFDNLAGKCERYTWQSADRVLPVTNVLGEEIEAAGVSPEKIVVIPNGVNRERFCETPSLEEAKARLDLEGRTVIGFTGFVRPWHGLGQILELVNAVSEESLTLLLVGDGPARPDLERQARELGVGDRLRVTGIVPREQVARYVAAFDIAVQPDVVAYASPLKLFEYLALGRAIVAPDRPNIREVLRDGENALLFEPGNADDLARKIERLCRDRDLRNCIRQGARATIDTRRLTWDHNAETVAAVARQCRQAGT